jgi:hypothetical protein
LSLWSLVLLLCPAFAFYTMTKNFRLSMPSLRYWFW